MHSETPAGNVSSCDAALELLAAARFGEWQGLPSTCSIDDLSRRFGPPLGGPARAALGEDQLPTDFMVFGLNGQSRPLRVFEEHRRVLLLDLEYPTLGGDADTLQAALGAPAARLDFPWNVLLLKDAEWVYPGRGLTLFINPDTRKILRWAVYTPTDLETYMRRLRLQLAEHELPLVESSAEQER
jgi:hypothetical protein